MTHGMARRRFLGAMGAAAFGSHARISDTVGPGHGDRGIGTACVTGPRSQMGCPDTPETQPQGCTVCDRGISAARATNG